MWNDKIMSVNINFSCQWGHLKEWNFYNFHFLLKFLSFLSIHFHFGLLIVVCWCWQHLHHFRLSCVVVSFCENSTTKWAELSKWMDYVWVIWYANYFRYLLWYQQNYKMEKNDSVSRANQMFVIQCSNVVDL